MYTTLYILTIYSIIYNCVNGKIPDKIVGGEICGFQEKRYIVSIQSNSYHICGGNIISPYHVITTASCIVIHENFVIFGNLAVFSGSHDLRGGNTGDYLKIIDVEIVIIHPEYDPKKFWINDISILKLTEEIPVDIVRRQIKIPTSDILYGKLTVAGWGESHFEPLNFLRKMDATKLRKHTCNSHFKNFGFVHGIQQCALSDNPSIEYVTEGDSGDPVATRKFLIGIVSLISMENAKPFVYTKVYLYKTWIFENIQKY